MARALRSVLLVSLLLAACGDDDGGGPTGDGPVGGGDAMGGGDGGGPGVDGNGSAADAPPGSGKVCGGIAGFTCPGDEWCDYPEESCGAGDIQGVCRARPTSCSDPISMDVCACDGQLYSTECDANMAGFDLGMPEDC